MKKKVLNVLIVALSWIEDKHNKTIKQSEKAVSIYARALFRFHDLASKTKVILIKRNLLT